MKTRFIASLLVLVCMCIGIGQVDAQKFGYINANQLLAQMPETKTADEQIVALREDLTAKGETMASALQIKFEDFYAKAEAGELTRVQMQEKEKNLARERDDLIAYEKEMQQKLAQKREELYGPILAKVQSAIDEVAEEKDFQFVFDASAGLSVMVYADESVDIMDMVKAKLGIE